MLQQKDESSSPSPHDSTTTNQQFSESLLKLYSCDLISFANESLGRNKVRSLQLPNTLSSIDDFQQACIQVGTLWRNECAVGGEEFQNKLKDQGILHFCLQILKNYFDHLNKWEALDSRRTALVLFQVLANAMTANKPIQIHLYEISDSIFFKQIIPKALILGKNFTNIACMAIYNSIAKGNLQIEELMIQLLERLYDSKHTEEWVFLIYKKYFLSKAYLTEESEEFFFHSGGDTCQLMLKQISSDFEQTTEEEPAVLLLNLLEIIDQFSNEQVQDKEPTPAANTYKSLIGFCLKIINVLREKFLPTNAVGGSSIGILNYKQFECLFVSLECLSNLSSLLILTSAKSPEIELRIECISTMLTLLGLSCAVKELKNEGSGICLDIFEHTGLLVFEDLEEKKGMYLGYKTLLIRSIANLTYKSRQIQNFVREQEGLPLVLSCCGVQDQHPYLREWGVFCVRNLTEDNEENQKFIQGMNLEGIDAQSEEILAKQGFKASVQNGKINLEKVVPQTVEKNESNETDENNKNSESKL